MLLLATLSLSRLGYETVTASDPTTAMARFLEHEGRFHAILLDYRLPATTGFDVWKRLREYRQGVPGILMTGACEDGAIARQAAQQGLVYLEKPFTLRALRELMESVAAPA